MSYSEPAQASRERADDRAARDRALFERIASSYARKDLYAPSRIARRARLLRTLESVPLAPDSDVLEVGCGAGFAARYLRGRYRSYTGIDYSDELIAFAAREAEGPGVVFEASDLYAWQPGSVYDVIFAIGVLHHMPDIPRAMTAMRSMLKPGGYLVVNEPQPANIVFHWLRRLRALVDASYSSEQEELPKSTLIAHFDDAGFEDVRTRAQGLLATPFAEVALGPRALALPASSLACRIDTWLEDRCQPMLAVTAWNLIVSGRRAIHEDS